MYFPAGSSIAIVMHKAASLRTHSAAAQEQKASTAMLQYSADRRNQVNSVARRGLVFQALEPRMKLVDNLAYQYI